MLVLLQCILLLYSFCFVSGGTVCPSRSDIYPCICINRHIGKKKVETTLVCQNLVSDKSLNFISFKDMDIDTFLLYDSFWNMPPPRLNEQRVPVNVLNVYRIKDIEIVDSKLNHFGCPIETREICGTNYLKRLTSINSTLGEKSFCNNNVLALNSWIGCPEGIEYLKIDNGLPPDTNLKPDFFFTSMTKLKELHLPNNRISRIDKRTFSTTTFPVLHTLNLTRNALKDVKTLFSTPMNIKHLDLSYNNLRTIVAFSYLPHLETLKLMHTNLLQLQENDWNTIPVTIKHIDLSDNAIKCECSEFQWFNGTLPINTLISGSCVSPPEVKDMKLRRASRALIERCDSNGVIGSKRKKN